MNIHPIRSDQDHRAALAEIERLWGAAAGTEDGDKLDILLALVTNTRKPVGQSRSHLGILLMSFSMQLMNWATLKRS